MSQPLDQAGRIGRYEVLHALGHGAMGAVYAARDARLGRTVAIKVLKSRNPHPEQQARIQREAHAMARLSHPNVAQVYEVGEVDGQTFIAMEYVAGATLRSWQQIERPWSELLEMYLRVGDGLVAAHAAGIVHRDLKPANVLVGVDGRPRVIDFGLARQDEAAPPAAVVSGVSTGPVDALTQAGALLGTPAYMAPEQLAGRAAGPASDQFSFCVSLFEALYRRAPFDRRSLTSRLRAIETGLVRVPDDRRGVPDWLHRAILRGLAAAPSDRWPSLADMLAECRRDRRKDGATGWRLRGAMLGVFGLLIVLPLAWLGQHLAGVMTYSHAALLDAGVCVLATASAQVGRRWLPPSEYNEQAVRLLRGFAIAPGLAHLLGWLVGVTPTQCAPFLLGMLGMLGFGAWRPGLPLPMAQAFIMSGAALVAARWPAHAWWSIVGASALVLLAAIVLITWLDRGGRLEARARSARRR